MPLPSTTDRQVPPAGKLVFADEAAAALIGPALAMLCDPAGAGWERVKDNGSRAVFRGRIGSREVYVKHYRRRSLLRTILQRLGLADAQREMKFSEYLRRHGVPTARALAAMTGPVEWLCTEAVADAQGLDQWHVVTLAGGPAGARDISQATVRLAEMVGRMHACGVIHCDLHGGNILVRQKDGTIDLVLMDLHRMARRRRLSRRAMSANLAQLFHDRAHFTTRTQRLRFLKHYLRTSGASGSLRGWHLMVEHFAHAHGKRQYANRDRRIAGDDRYFTRVQLPGGWRGLAVLRSKHCLGGSQAARLIFTRQDWQQALADVDRLLADPANEIVKNSPSKQVLRRRLQVGPHQLEVCIHRPRRKHRWKILLDCLRPSQSRRAFQLGHELLNRRIATALPLACMDRRVGPVLVESVLITELVDCPGLKPFLNTWLAPLPQGDLHLTVPQQRQLAQEVLRQMGRLLQRLHDNNYAHRDLSANNLLVQWVATSPELVLVNLNGLRRTRWITQRRRYQGLMRLNVSLLECPVVNHAGQLRMLLGYLRRPGSGRINFKPYWRTLEAWSAKKLQQQIRTRRHRQRAVRRPLP